MNRALYSGLSGAVAQQSKMDVTANNLANVGTVAFKAARTTFQDAYYQTLRSGSSAQDNVGGVSPTQVGTGVSVGATTIVDAQGAVQNTGQALDAAIDGDGLFTVVGPEGVFYTRDGSFKLDETSTLVMASNGYRVQGWMATDGQVNTGGPLTGLVFPLNTVRPPKATDEVSLCGNLTAGGTNTQSSSVTVYDSLGKTHDLSLTFAPGAGSSWNVTAKFDGGASTALGTVSFDTLGQYSAGGPTVTLAATPTGAAPMSMAIDVSKLTQFASGVAVSATDQNGYAAAALKEVNVNDGGIIQGSYADGRSMTLGQLAVATFANVSGLAHSGSNLFQSSPSSGLAQIGAASEGGRGAVVGRSLEQSSADLTSSFLDMLITQRAYQASTRVISTASSLIQDAIQLADR
ncbi:flagellar hook protein FlgE [bacterium]|nr:flagellar hook protein FlgE [bacterium]